MPLNVQGREQRAHRRLEHRAAGGLGAGRDPALRGTRSVVAMSALGHLYECNCAIPGALQVDPAVVLGWVQLAGSPT